MLRNSRDTNGLTELEYLEQYDIKGYDRPSVTVDIMLLTISDCMTANYRKLSEKKMKVLLIKRKEHPFFGQWALPGGFVRLNESLEAAAYRELEEETGIGNIYLEQLYTYGEVERDPRGRIISTSYLSLVNKDEIDIHAGSDAEDAQWFDIGYGLVKEERVMHKEGFDESKYYDLVFTNEENQLKATVKVCRYVRNRQIAYSRTIVDSDGIAFDHGMIIQQGIERLRSKLEYTDIVFHLMPNLFTLSELQIAYEEILDTSLLKANFRRKISKMVTETNEMTSVGGHRPSKLYKFNPLWERQD